MNSRLVPVSLTNLSIAALLSMAACSGDDTGSGNTAATTGATGNTPTSAAATTQTTAMTTMTTADTTATNTDGGSTGTTTDADTTAGEDTTGGNKIACPYTPIAGNQVGFELVADGFASPVLVVGDPVEQDVLYVVQRGGQIKRLEPGMNSAPAGNWLDIPVSATFEEGLLSFAFHPDYANNDLIYVLHSPSPDAWRVTEYPVEGGTPNVGAGREVFGTAQPQANHNGGMIQFGPDGYLYISVGDGGVQGDGCGNGQDGSTHHGSIIRIDVAADGQPDSATSCGSGSPQCNCDPLGGFDFTIPADNPFVDDPSVRDEIYAIGFRNPWRFSFDAVDGSLWVGDVGQNGFEEVTVVEAGSNHGWGDMEGNNCFGGAACDTSAAPGQTNSDGLVAPIVDYPLQGGRQAVIGLGNYRSCEVEAFAGIYFFGDLGTGEVFAATYDGATANDIGVVATVPNGDSMYGGGYNAYGDVFIAAVPQFGGSGSIYRVTAQQ